MRAPALLLALLASSLALAATPGAPATAPLEGPALARFTLLRETVAREAPRARVWWWAWTGTYAALTVGQAAPLPFVQDVDLRIDLAVGAASAAVGVALMVLSPLSVMAHEPRYAALTADEAGLTAAERLLREDADDEAFCTSWVMHVGNVAFNLGVGVLLGLAWRHWESGVLNFALGTLVGEVMIWTQPRALPDLAAAGGQVAVTPWAADGRAGLALVGGF